MRPPISAPPGWHANRGHPPVFYPLHEDDPCPAALIHADDAETARVMVRLLNGRKPEAGWPIFGRPYPTRWTLTGDPFDITHWRRA